MIPYKIDVLDHGFVRFVEDWGYGDAKLSEAGIIEAARQSTQGSFRGWETDSKLLAHLYKHHHDTPFEFAGMVIEVKAPIFVFREWHRHRTQSYNEMSARFTAMPDENYIPSVERLLMRGGANKQAQSVGIPLDEKAAILFQEGLVVTYKMAQDLYTLALQAGVSKELARLCVPVARYSQMRASTCLRCWLMFLTLRMDPMAQWEIRQYANAVGQVIADRFPQTWRLFNNSVAKDQQT